MDMAESNLLQPEITQSAVTVASSVQSGGGALEERTDRSSLRHSFVVRITHWIHAVCFIAFVLSGLAILLAYPRLHWGETGTLGAPALVDLPLPMVLDLGIRGPGRYLHFLTAWVALFSGLLYAVSGLYTNHFRRDLLPARSDLRWQTIRNVVSHHVHLRRSMRDDVHRYNVLQRVSYSVVVFGLFPFMFLTGFAMSPSITSVFPVFATMFGGHQSARTLHFVAANLLILFVMVHVAMVSLSGFGRRCRAMITGYSAARKKCS